MLLLSQNSLQSIIIIIQRFQSACDNIRIAETPSQKLTLLFVIFAVFRGGGEGRDLLLTTVYVYLLRLR